MKKFLKEESIKFLFGLCSTALGVLIALLINSSVESHRDFHKYKILLKAIEIEALQNEIILEESFLSNYENGIIRRDFSLDVCEEVLTNEVFLNHASSCNISRLTDYILTLRRANNFRRADEEYKNNPIPSTTQYSKDLTIAFGNVLGNCEVIIKETSRISHDCF